jgi:hypothetical protein
MGTINNDLKMVGVAIGKILLMLNELESKISNGNDVNNNKEEFASLAYLCRIGILDRIEKNNWNEFTPITIRTGIFSSQKTTLESGMELTLGRIYKLVEMDLDTEGYVLDVVHKRNLFDLFDSQITPKNKRKFLEDL